MADNQENMEAPKAKEVQVEPVDGPATSVNKSKNQEKAVEFLSSSKTANRLSASALLTTQLLVQDAERQAKEGNNSETIKKLTSYKAQKNLNNSVLEILEKVAAGVPFVEGSVDDKVKGSDATVWETYKAKKALILALIDNAPEDFKTNFKSTIDMVNRRLNPSEEQKPTIKLYKGDMKKGFVNSVVYNNFYASNSWGKKNVIRPWRKFKKNVRKLFEPSAATKLARLQRRNNRIKSKLARQHAIEEAKKWIKSRPSWLNKKRKEYGGKIAKWFKNNTKVGRKLVDLNKRRKEWWQKNKATVKKVVKYTGYAIGGAALIASGAWAFGAAPVAIAGVTASLGYGSYKGSMWLYKNQIKPGYDKLKTNVKGKMDASIENANKDQEKYAQRNPHPYKGKDPVYTMSEEDQKKIDMALNAYTNQARPTQEVTMSNGNVVTRKDTTKWVADDVERKASAELLGKLIQPKDKGGMELPPEQAKKIMDFFQKQGLMKSTYDDIAKDDSLNKPVNEQERDQRPGSAGDKPKEDKGEERAEDAEKDAPKEIPLEKQMESLTLESHQQNAVSSGLQVLKQMKKNGSDKQVLEEATQNYMQTFETLGVSPEKIAQIEEMNPDLFPKKEQEVDNKKKENEGTGIFETVIEKNDKDVGVEINHGKGDIQLENDQPSDTPQSDTLVEEQGEKAKIVVMDVQKEKIKELTPERQEQIMTKIFKEVTPRDKALVKSINNLVVSLQSGRASEEDIKCFGERLGKRMPGSHIDGSKHFNLKEDQVIAVKNYVVSQLNGNTVEKDKAMKNLGLNKEQSASSVHNADSRVIAKAQALMTNAND